MLLQPSPTNWPCLQMKPGEKPSVSTPGDLTNFQIPAKPPLMMPPLSMKQLDQLVPIILTKGWDLGPWHSWAGRKVPRLALKPDPLIYDHLPNSPNCFPACFSVYKTQELQLLN
jgi:hypothetical protein